MITGTYDWENILDRAGKIDDRLYNTWMEILADDEYETLAQFFNEDNFPRYDFDSEEYVDVNTRKLQEKVLRGKDRLKLINYAFMLGQLVGEAVYTVKHEE